MLPQCILIRMRWRETPPEYQPRDSHSSAFIFYFFFIIMRSSRAFLYLTCESAAIPNFFGMQIQFSQLLMGGRYKHPRKRRLVKFTSEIIFQIVYPFNLVMLSSPFLIAAPFSLFVFASGNMQISVISPENAYTAVFLSLSPKGTG